MNRSKLTTARAMSVFIAAALGFHAVAASAGILSSDQTVIKYVVRFADLDVSKIEGASALYSRLRHAAGVVCEPLESRAMALSQKYHACMDKAVADAVASVDKPLLSQYHQLRTKGDSAGLVQVAKTN